MMTWRKKKCIRALGLDEADCSDSEDGGPLSSLGTDGESLAGGSPRTDHPSAAAVSALYGTLPKSPLVARPLLSPLVPPTTPPGLLHSPARHLPTTPSSQYSLHSPRPHHLSSVAAAAAAAAAAASSSPHSSSSTSLLLAT